MCDVEKELAKATGTDSSEGWLAKGTGNVLAPGGTFAPGAGGLNPLNPDSVVGRMTRDVGQLNPFNSDTVMAKVYNNIGKDMERDPLKWVAIAACIAAGPAGWQMIPYVNAVAALTSKNSTPEEWLTEGAKAYLIQAGGEYIANNVTGVGPQTDITTGETFAGTGVTGATESAKVGAVAGNISRNIFATAARKGNTDVNSAQIITGALTSEALNEAFKYVPGFSDLSKSDQATAVNAFKVAATKDSNAAYQLFNQGFDAAIKGLDKAAKGIGYRDLNHQNAVNNFVQDQGSTEDVEAFNRIEKDAQDKYDNYVAYQDKQKAFDTAQKEYIAAKGQYDYYNGLLTPGPGRYKVVGVASWQNARAAAAATMSAANKTLEDNRVQPGALQQADDDYVNARAKVLDQNVVVNTYMKEGWDNLSQQKAAATAGYTTPEAYDTYLIDKPNTDAIKEGWDSLDEKKAAATAGYTDPTKYDTYLTDKTANETAKTEGWTGSTQKAEAATAGYTDPTEYTNYLSGLNTNANTGGTSTTTGDGTAMGDTTKPLAGADAYKYDPANKTYTLTSDDGSTITLDENGDVVSSTEATDTSWAGLTDEKTGNLKLPKLPSGFTPTVKPPAKKTTTTTTTTTGTGNTAVTTGTGNTAITTGSNTAVVTGSGTTALNSDQILSLLNVFGGSGGQQQQQQVPYTPAQVPVADIKSYYNTIRGIAGENLLPESKEEKEKSSIDNLFAEGGTVNKSYDDVIRGIAGENLLGQPKEKKEKSSIEEMFFEGGTVDDLLRILRS